MSKMKKKNVTLAVTNLWWNKSTNLDGVCPSYFSGIGCFSERHQATNEIIVLRSPLCDVMVAGSHLLRRTWRLKSKHGGPSCLDITANYPLGLNASRQKPIFVLLCTKNVTNFCHFRHSRWYSRKPSFG